MIKDKINRLSPGTKSSIALFVASVISSGISYIFTPIYTRILPSEIFGKTSLFMTWYSIFGIVAMFSLSNGVFNNGMADWPKKRDEYSYSLLILSNIITIVFSVIIICIYPIIEPIIKIEKKYFFLMIGLFLTFPAYNFWTVRQRYEYKYKYVVIWSIVCALLSPLCAVVSILCNDKLLEARIFGAEIPLFIIYLVFYIYVGRRVSFKLDCSFWKTAFMFNLPLIPHYLSTYMLNSSDKIMISYLINDTATAYYSVAYSVSALATIVWSAVNSSLIPFTYENCKNKTYGNIRKVTTPILVCFAGVCIAVIMLAPEVVSIMATAEYKEAIYAIPPIVGGIFFQVQYYMYANIVYYYKRPKYIMYASVTATIANLILNYVFIKRYGYIAAGYTTLVCFMIQALLDYVAYRKTIKTHVYNWKLIMALSVIVIVISLISNAIYNYSIIRYAIIIILCVIAIVFRKEIYNMKNIKSKAR